MMECIMRLTFILIGLAFLAFVPESLMAQGALDATAI